MKRHAVIAAAIFSSAAFVAGCAKTTTDAAAPAPAEKPAPIVKAFAPDVDFAAVAAAALADPGRPEADRADDARRKSATALEFFRVGPGMAVFEIEAGAGWYTELLSHAVGASGSVVMQNPEGFRAFVGEQIDARMANDRLANVRQSLTNFDALDAADASVDLVTWVQGPHELYYTPSEGVSLGDPARSYSEIYRILKSGGAFVVIDHSAVPGAPESTGNDLHRIDRAIVVEMAEAAGFTLEGESDFLANPADTRDIAVFDPAIRGMTDQFALRFVK
jgi:predicted methyltransferase